MPLFFYQKNGISIDIWCTICYIIFAGEIKQQNRKEVRAMNDHKKPSDLQLAVVAGVVAGLIVELIKALAQFLINY